MTCVYNKVERVIGVNTTRLGVGVVRVVDREVYQLPTLEIGVDVVDADDIVLQLDKHTV